MPLVHEFERLCNSCVDSSFKEDERKVNFEALDKLRVHTVGLLGGKAELWAFLADQGAATCISQACPRCRRVSEPLRVCSGSNAVEHSVYIAK